MQIGSVNKAIVLGRLGADPETKYLQSGQVVCNLRIATSETWLDRNEQKQERTEWHRVNIWGKVAESAGKHLVKGQRVYVEGRIQTRSYDDKDGVTRYSTEIVADVVTFLDRAQDKGERPADVGQERGQSQAQGAPRYRQAQTQEQPRRVPEQAVAAALPYVGVDDDRIPF